MKIEHVALYVNDLEEAREFFIITGFRGLISMVLHLTLLRILYS